MPSNMTSREINGTDAVAYADGGRRAFDLPAAAETLTGIITTLNGEPLTDMSGTSITTGTI